MASLSSRQLLTEVTFNLDKILTNINKELSCHAKAKSQGINTRREADYIKSLRQYRQELGDISKQAKGYLEPPRNPLDRTRFVRARNMATITDQSKDPFSEENINRKVNEIKEVAERQREYSQFRSLKELLSCYIRDVKRDCWLDGVPNNPYKTQGLLITINEREFTFLDTKTKEKFTFDVKDYTFSYSFESSIWFVALKPSRYKKLIHE